MREKKAPRPPDRAGRSASRLGAGLRRRGLVESPGAAAPARLGRRASSPCAWSNRRSPKTIPIPKRWPATACCCAAPDRTEAVWLRFVARPARQRDHHPVPGLVLPQAGGAGRAGVGADLGQRLLARQQGRARLDPDAQPRGQAAGPGRAHPGPATCRSRVPGSTRLSPSGSTASAPSSSRPACSALRRWPTACCAYHRCPHEPHLSLPDPIHDKAS